MQGLLLPSPGLPFEMVSNSTSPYSALPPVLSAVALSFLFAGILLLSLTFARMLLLFLRRPRGETGPLVDAAGGGAL